MPHYFLACGVCLFLAAFYEIVSLAVFAERAFYAARDELALVGLESLKARECALVRLFRDAIRAIIHLVVELHEIPQVARYAKRPRRKSAGGVSPENDPVLR